MLEHVLTEYSSFAGQMEPLRGGTFGGCGMARYLPGGIGGIGGLEQCMPGVRVGRLSASRCRQMQAESPKRVHGYLAIYRGDLQGCRNRPWRAPRPSKRRGSGK